MSASNSKFYTECGHTIAEEPDPTEPADLNGTQEVVRGRCPACSDPLSYVESGIEHLPTAPVVSYVRLIRGKAKKMLKSLRSNSDETKLMEDQWGTQMAPKTSGSNMDDEIVGKENIDTRQPIVDKTKDSYVIVTGGNSNVIAVQTPKSGQVSTEGKAADALAREAARANILGFADHITANFATMRQNIDEANQRIADINNFKLAHFMSQGVHRWTAAVQQAVQDCEDELVRECEKLARMV